MLIDTHAHLSFSQFKEDIDEVVKRANAAGVSKIINVGCDLQSCEGVVAMLAQYDCLYATLGMHPYEARDVNEDLMNKWRTLIAAEKRIVAIGECGLDYFKANVPKDIQAKAFKMQILLAGECGLPVIVHNREADSDTLEILEEMEKELGKKLKVVFHCYGSNLEFARKLWEKGYMTSFTGIITYPNAGDLREVVKEVPEDLFMVETDCPFLAPQKYRGKRNEPAYVVEVAEKIAELKSRKFEEIAEISTKNAEKFFRI